VPIRAMERRIWRSCAPRGMFLLLMADLAIQRAVRSEVAAGLGGPLLWAPTGGFELRVPITWTIDHEQRLLTAVCEGNVTLHDIEEYLDSVVVAGSMPYRKLFDGSRGDSSMTDEEMMMLGARIRAYHTEGKMGALAIVVTTDHTRGLARLFGALAAADRPIKIFRDSHAARRWLDAQPG
jgi:hypothetical protein